MSERRGREVELKLRVADLSALMKIAIAARGTLTPTTLQTNMFFDTKDRLLGMRGWLVRLRHEQTGTVEERVVTVKGAGQRSGNLTNVQEEEVTIDAAAARTIIAGGDPLAPLEGGSAVGAALGRTLRGFLHGRALELVGQMTNERTRVVCDLPLVEGGSFRATLELDRTCFPQSVIHHEVELEIPVHVDSEAAQRAFQALFDRAGVVGRNSPGKARRLFAALRGERLE